jgi:UDP-N-acetylglucosamine 2-epimerase
MSVFGTRPEATKMVPLIKKLEENSRIDSIVCVTAQHRQMLDQVLEKMKIKPDYDLDIMKQKQSLEYITSSVLEGVSRVLTEAKPDIVLVHGDTTTAFASSLAAFYNRIPVGHVEAGLRTQDKYYPFPEEMNRKLIDSIADIYFCPTETNKNNLKLEGIKDDKIFVTGNTAIDFLSYTSSENYIFECDKLNKIKYEGKRVITVEIHRRENLGQPIKSIMKVIREITDKYEDIIVVYPVHLHPEVQATANDYLSKHDRIYLLDPIDVFDMHNLIRRSYLVFTDSGGLQEEAPSLGVPVLVARNETERQEAVDAGTVKLAGTEEAKVRFELDNLLYDESIHAGMVKAENPYGDGNASERIINAIFQVFSM